MKTLHISDKKIIKLISDKNDLVKKGQDLTAEIEKLTAERHKTGVQIQKLKDKYTPMIQSEVKKYANTSKYDGIVSFDSDKGLIKITDGEITLNIQEEQDWLEEMKKERRAEIDKEQNK